MAGGPSIIGDRSVRGEEGVSIMSSPDIVQDIIAVVTILPSLTPVLQFALLALTGAFVLVSVLSRIVPSLGEAIWEDWPDSSLQLVLFTVVPVLVWIVMLVQVILRWDGRRPVRTFA